MKDFFFFTLILPFAAGLLNVIKMAYQVLKSKAFRYKVSVLQIELPQTMEVQFNLSFTASITDLVKIS